jgi:transcriptional regulator with XRE-family HTH domain
MPLNSEDLSAIARQEFCLALKTARERKGMTLAQIAEATKIPASLFAGLERNDLRRWPRGLFRRSFFRDYARTIGLPVAEACAEFVRLFPEDGGAEVVRAAIETASETAEADELPLVLDAAWHGPASTLLTRLCAATLDAAGIVAVASLAWVVGLGWPTITALFALAYFSLGTALFGESPAKWAIDRRHAILEAAMHGWTAIRSAWKPVADVLSEGFVRPDAGTPEPPQRLRVRIKVPQ